MSGQGGQSKSKLGIGTGRRKGQQQGKPTTLHHTILCYTLLSEVVSFLVYI